ncbi:peptidoglycan DD-metalloendopeptidase family protein [Clostridium paridis]|uniref:M23 family metallopeptidase n=1 Tax=Clostridium paridis TaxID=2803863 RepID=A0A937FK70_9CLOT|nr:M23 family metallopeptidase [Clostridium paridis]
MGNYNSEYKSYYGKIMERRKSNHIGSIGGEYQINRSIGEHSSKSFKDIIVRRIIQELVGTFILCLLILVCKSVKTEQTLAVYNYGKYAVNKGYTINEVIEYIKTFDVSSIKHKGEELADFLKEKVSNGQTIKSQMKENLVKPVLGSYVLKDDSSKLYSIEIKDGTEIISIGDGNVTKVSEDKTLGKYIVIDNGSGVESVYGNLGEIDVKEGDKISKGQMVAKGGNSNNEAKPSLLFQLKYMGEARDIKDYINL